MLCTAAGLGSSHASLSFSAQNNCYPLISWNTQRRVILIQATDTSKAEVLANSFNIPLAPIPSSLTRGLHCSVSQAFFIGAEISQKPLHTVSILSGSGFFHVLVGCNVCGRESVFCSVTQFLWVVRFCKGLFYIKNSNNKDQQWLLRKGKMICSN